MSASRQGRGCRLMKVYNAIFIWFTTKFIHLVGDLTSSCSLLELCRFISRRRKPLNIYSDNGTLLVGAYEDISKFLKSNYNSLGETSANEGTAFHFIPAYTNHFSGFWEVGVKSTNPGVVWRIFNRICPLLLSSASGWNQRFQRPVSCSRTSTI